MTLTNISTHIISYLLLFCFKKKNKVKKEETKMLQRVKHTTQSTNESNSKRSRKLKIRME